LVLRWTKRIICNKIDRSYYSAILYIIYVQSTVLQILSEGNFMQKGPSHKVISILALLYADFSVGRYIPNKRSRSNFHLNPATSGDR